MATWLKHVMTMILCCDQEVNILKMTDFRCRIRLLLKELQIIYHKKLNMINCFCGFMGLAHHCTRKIKGSIKIANCPTDCKVCEEEADRKEYNFIRWKTNHDGYMVCGTCYDKLGDNPICTDCFCANCYTSLSENCCCFKD